MRDQTGFSKAEKLVIAACSLGMLACLAGLFRDDERLWGENGIFDDRPVIGRVTRFMNDARHRRLGTFVWREARNDQSIQAGDSIFSGGESTAEIKLEKGGRLFVEENSLVVFEESGDQPIGNLLSGRFRVSVDGEMKVKLKGRTTSIQAVRSEIELSIEDGKKPQARLLVGESAQLMMSPGDARSEGESDPAGPQSPDKMKTEDEFVSLSLTDQAPLSLPVEEPTEGSVEELMEEPGPELRHTGDADLDVLAIPDTGLSHKKAMPPTDESLAPASDLNDTESAPETRLSDSTLRKSLLDSLRTAMTLFKQTKTTRANAPVESPRPSAMEASIASASPSSSNPQPDPAKQSSPVESRVSGVASGLKGVAPMAKSQPAPTSAPLARAPQSLPPQNQMKIETSHLPESDQKPKDSYLSFEGLFRVLESSQQVAHQTATHRSAGFGVHVLHWRDAHGYEGTYRNSLIGINEEGQQSAVHEGEARYHYRFRPRPPWPRTTPLHFSLFGGVELYRNSGPHVLETYGLFNTGATISVALSKRWSIGGEFVYGLGPEKSAKQLFAGHIKYRINHRWSFGLGLRTQFYDAGSSSLIPTSMHPFREGFTEGISSLDLGF